MMYFTNLENGEDLELNIQLMANFLSSDKPFLKFDQ